MHTISDIEQSIAHLPPEGLAEFRAWFEAFEAEQWDKQLEKDIQAGKLDRLAEQAFAEFKQGRCKEL